MSSFYHHFTEHGDIAFFAYMVSPYGYPINGFISLFEPKFIYYVPNWMTTICHRCYAYTCSPTLPSETPKLYVTYHILYDL